MMKFKPKCEDTYTITGVVEELSIHGVPKDSLGALQVLGTNGQTFHVGSGFTFSDRKLYWERKEHLIGRKARIKYQHLTPRGVPRHPVIVEIV
jgi:ATP-dependent DNA ligase